MRAAQFHPELSNVAAYAWACGCGLLLVVVARRQWRFARWLRTQPPIRDEAIRSLLESCKARIGVRRHVELIEARGIPFPALFGWPKPLLLLPSESLPHLSEAELRLIMLHELAHIRRADIPLNWAMMAGQAMHWFNPLVWLALRQLRSDRELVCDSMVLEVLDRPEHRAYGQALLKLLERAEPAVVNPALLSILGHRHNLQKRIIMISEFKPATRTTWGLTTVLAAVVCCLTFTRAAEQKMAPAALPETPKALASPPAEATVLDSMRIRLKNLEHRILQLQEEMDQLRLALHLPAYLAETEGRGSSHPEALRLLEQEEATASTSAARTQTLLDQLMALPSDQLPQAIPTAVPDAELIQLLRELNNREAQCASLEQDFGPENAQVRSVKKAMAAVKVQIEARVQGILRGLRTQVAAQQASVTALHKASQETTLRDAELAAQYRPYFKAKRDLEILEGVRHRLMTELLQREYISVPPAP
ncbi:MAG: M56 family metallopeptidase [Verrucomicrobiota bacterium]